MVSSTLRCCMVCDVPLITTKHYVKVNSSKVLRTGLQEQLVNVFEDLCDIDEHNQYLCSKCISKIKSASKLTNLRVDLNSMTQWPNTALVHPNLDLLCLRETFHRSSKEVLRMSMHRHHFPPLRAHLSELKVKQVPVQVAQTQSDRHYFHQERPHLR